MNEYIKVLLDLCDKSIKKDEVPVAAIIVKDGKIISKAYNKRKNNCSVLDHAEIIAIKKANKKIKDWRLDGCDLYVTLKPCDMCAEVIMASRINNVYYLLDKPKNKLKYSDTKIIDISKDYENESKKYARKLGDFFAKKRKK